MIILGIIIFILGCSLSSVESINAEREYNERKRQKEILKALNEREKKYPEAKRTIQRRIMRDEYGNTIGEEIIEEFDL